MLWAILSGAAAVTNAVYFITHKEFLKKLDANLLAACDFFCIAAFLFVLSLSNGIPATTGPLFLPAILITTILNVVATMLIFRALTISDISLAIPMLSFTPLFLIATAFFLLGELPSVEGTLGIIIIVAGSYILNTAAEHTRLSDPFRTMYTDKGVRIMLYVAFLYSIAINFDKMVVLESDVFYGPAIVFLLLGIAFGILSVLSYRGFLPAVPGRLCQRELSRNGTTPATNWRYLAGAGILTGMLVTIEAVCINSAYLVQIVPYVIALKRMSIILVVLYGTIVFQEGEILRRLTGAAMMVLGAVLILAFL